MCCHKKCCAKCQRSTSCGPIESPTSTTSSSMTINQPEFKLTEPPTNENDDFDEIEDVK